MILGVSATLASLQSATGINDDDVVDLAKVAVSSLIRTFGLCTSLSV